jgi:23S rRNA pseudouridine1911/1915/1917 synthase
VKLETGRTHQIRVHLSFLGYPILGDTLYGGRADERIYLHAHTLYFMHPRTGDKLEIKSPLKPLLGGTLTAN